jgi:mRNA interferase HigB
MTFSKNERTLRYQGYIKGNDYRLITSIVYATQRIYIKYVLTHSEYDRDKWKDDPYY